MSYPGGIMSGGGDNVRGVLSGGIMSMHRSRSVYIEHNFLRTYKTSVKSLMGSGKFLYSNIFVLGCYIEVSFRISLLLILGKLVV